jgi:heme exporter protein B
MRDTKSGARLGQPHGGPRHPQPVNAVLRRDLRIETRTPQVVPGMALFAISAFVVFHFALQQRSVEGNLAAGVLWVTLLLAAVLGIARQFVADREEGGFEGFLLAPVDRTALLVAKAASLFLFLVALEVVAVPAFLVMLLGPSPVEFWRLLLALVLADLGIAFVGTLVGALAVQSRARDLLVPLLALPLLIPLLIGAVKLSAPVFGGPAAAARWPWVLALYDLVFGLVAYAVFDFLLED